MITMKNSKILCYNCSEEITEYYHDGYNGKRGKCHSCKVDFPLEWSW